MCFLTAHLEKVPLTGSSGSLPQLQSIWSSASTPVCNLFFRGPGDCEFTFWLGVVKSSVMWFIPVVSSCTLYLFKAPVSSPPYTALELKLLCIVMCLGKKKSKKRHLADTLSSSFEQVKIRSLI